MSKLYFAYELDQYRTYHATPSARHVTYGEFPACFIQAPDLARARSFAEAKWIDVQGTRRFLSENDCEITSIPDFEEQSTWVMRF